MTAPKYAQAAAIVRAQVAAPAGVPAQPFPPRGPAPTALVRVTLHWSDETETVFYPPSGPGTAP